MYINYDNNRGRNVRVEVLSVYRTGCYKVKMSNGKTKGWYLNSASGKITSITMGKEKFIGYGHIEALK